jgi:hypothetical protein
MRKALNPSWPSCPRNPSRRLHPLLPPTLPVPQQRLEEKTVEPNRTADWVESSKQRIQAKEEEFPTGTL